jgi:hypothetical protein
MSHNSGRKALYEVLGKAKPKSGYERLKERMHLGKPVGPRELFAPPKSKTPDDMVKWPKRPKMIQVNAGRLEISLPYQLAIAGFLAIVLIMVVFFRLGQNSAVSGDKPADKPPVKTPASVPPRPAKPALRSEVTQPVISAPVIAETVARAVANALKATNRIVIQSWPDKSQLEPAVTYFAENGIKTEIRKISGEYYLVTGDRYENPQREGTDGYKVRQKIVELGAKYQAPPGYASFGSEPFHDAYGMKFDN